jgi:hypothetical protein
MRPAAEAILTTFVKEETSGTIAEGKQV